MISSMPHHQSVSSTGVHKPPLHRRPRSRQSRCTGAQKSRESNITAESSQHASGEMRQSAEADVFEGAMGEFSLTGEQGTAGSKAMSGVAASASSTPSHSTRDMGSLDASSGNGGARHQRWPAVPGAHGTSLSDPMMGRPLHVAQASTAPATPVASSMSLQQRQAQWLSRVAPNTTNPSLAMRQISAVDVNSSQDASRHGSDAASNSPGPATCLLSSNQFASSLATLAEGGPNAEQDGHSMPGITIWSRANTQVRNMELGLAWATDGATTAACIMCTHPFVHDVCRHACLTVASCAPHHVC